MSAESQDIPSSPMFSHDNITVRDSLITSPSCRSFIPIVRVSNTPLVTSQGDTEGASSVMFSPLIIRPSHSPDERMRKQSLGSKETAGTSSSGLSFIPSFMSVQEEPEPTSEDSIASAASVVLFKEGYDSSDEDEESDNTPPPPPLFTASSSDASKKNRHGVLDYGLKPVPIYEDDDEDDDATPPLPAKKVVEEKECILVPPLTILDKFDRSQKLSMSDLSRVDSDDQMNEILRMENPQLCGLEDVNAKMNFNSSKRRLTVAQINSDVEASRSESKSGSVDRADTLKFPEITKLRLHLESKLQHPSKEKLFLVTQQGMFGPKKMIQYVCTHMYCIFLCEQLDFTKTLHKHLQCEGGMNSLFGCEVCRNAYQRLVTTIDNEEDDQTLLKNQRQGKQQMNKILNYQEKSLPGLIVDPSSTVSTVLGTVSMSDQEVHEHEYTLPSMIRCSCSGADTLCYAKIEGEGISPNTPQSIWKCIPLVHVKPYIGIEKEPTVFQLETKQGALHVFTFREPVLQQAFLSCVTTCLSYINYHQTKQSQYTELVMHGDEEDAVYSVGKEMFDRTLVYGTYSQRIHIDMNAFDRKDHVYQHREGLSACDLPIGQIHVTKKRGYCMCRGACLGTEVCHCNGKHVLCETCCNQHISSAVPLEPLRRPLVIPFSNIIMPKQNIFTCTFNTGSSAFSEDQMAKLLHRMDTTEVSTWQEEYGLIRSKLVGALNADLVVIGLQECSDIAAWFNSTLQLINSKHFQSLQYVPEDRPAWGSTLEEPMEWSKSTTKGTKVQYDVVGQTKLWGIGILVLCRRSLAGYFHTVTDASVATGVGGVLGNKGGCAVYFEFLRSSFCFVNCHFPAREERLAARNRTQVRIAKTLSTKLREKLKRNHPIYKNANVSSQLQPRSYHLCPQHLASLNTSVVLQSEHSWSAAGKHTTAVVAYDECSNCIALSGNSNVLQNGTTPFDLFCHVDHVLWLGDLNYRNIIDFKTAKTHCMNQDYDKLLAVDQQSYEMRANRVFVGMTEPKLLFQPSYRWARQILELSNKREQPCSYTDRVLSKGLVCVSYGSREDVGGSDHRPVVALYQATLASARVNQDLGQKPDTKNTEQVAIERPCEHILLAEEKCAEGVDVEEYQICDCAGPRSDQVLSCGCISVCCCPVPLVKLSTDNATKQVIVNSFELQSVWAAWLGNIVFLPLNTEDMGVEEEDEDVDVNDGYPRSDYKVIIEGRLTSMSINPQYRQDGETTSLAVDQRSIKHTLAAAGAIQPDLGLPMFTMSNRVLQGRASSLPPRLEVPGSPEDTVAFYLESKDAPKPLVSPAIHIERHDCFLQTSSLQSFTSVTAVDERSVHTYSFESHMCLPLYATSLDQVMDSSLNFSVVAPSLVAATTIPLMPFVQKIIAQDYTPTPLTLLVQNGGKLQGILCCTVKLAKNRGYIVK